MKDLKELTRPNIWALKPYSSARDEYNGAEASVFLDANENPYNTPNNRYPDPMQRELKNMIAPIKKVDPDTIFLGNGSDEAIDLVYRAFCIPGVDNVAAIDPTYGMYQVCADVNDVEYRKVLLDENYQFSADKLLAATDDHTKLVFLCSPNNPTGNNLDRREMEKLLDTFQGLVIIDEAYSDFSDAPSFLADLDKYPNLIVFQTPDTIFLGNGSDEAIDLVYRAFCIPGVDNVAAIDPTYGMYQVCADVNDVEYRKVLLDENYQFSADKLLAATDDHTKLVFLCSPNNPTGNNLDRREMEKLLDTFQGLVIIDEAYSDFSDAPSFLADLDKYPNLIVFQTFSKAWGCAAIRLGMAFASKEIISIFSKIKYPYNVNLLTQKEAVMMLHRHYEVERWVKSLLEERTRLVNEFVELPCCEKIYPTDANFFLAKVTDAKKIYNYLVGKGIIVRNRTNISLCRDCLRVTIGTRPENDMLLEALKNYEC
uniref:histidinol-phosphate transaminase n=1 Tax=Phocaeicola dorei TaxID=357276 RepID=UPI00402A28D4